MLITVIPVGCRASEIGTPGRERLPVRPSHPSFSGPDVGLDLPNGRGYSGPDIVPTRVAVSQHLPCTSLGPIWGARAEFVEHRLGTPLVVAIQ
jgi:hypothetical protein